MAKVIKLKKGYNIVIKGKVVSEYLDIPQPATFAIKPTDFEDIAPIPKLLVNEGTKVKAGDALFYDKDRPDMLFTAPVSGEVIEIRRGDQRRITEVIIKADKQIEYKSFKKADPNGLDREKIIQYLLGSGLWQAIIQRPYGIIANPEDTPKSIFISTFDTSPLAPDKDVLVKGKGAIFQAGLDALRKLTEGKIYLNLYHDRPHAVEFEEAKGVEINYFSGPHPTGNVGVQIHHLDPIKKGEIVWHVDPLDILTIGTLFMEGKYVPERIIDFAGPGLKATGFFKTYIGACVENVVKDNLIKKKTRIISGNVLTGKTIEANGFLGYYDHLVTVIPEGDEHEFLGWLLPSYPRPSISKSFISGWLATMGLDESYNVNTNMHGEERAFVVSGQYESVLPMDLYPVHLIKSIMYKDFDQMEGLGIYEVIEEDLALCEFVCTSKIDVQEILREGLDLMRKEG
ncbi:MAG: Na(+)-translocating NADH-quinone reductase subunit A [Bacteroidetes bacterium]|nr:Na(+)-translocating NADH-quinone reductase subunit A [Bacteroidota bacterium]